ncbi:acyl carrier protein [Paenibacillus sp. F411]|uniref:acyl carrier protein n=1 Tax=Paenibacillus sp. F411 TaxID=2820239 RepID=UPI001AAE7E3E|nr:acyl carrier protein [Paenibacillus sp. F411]MBO2942765.1 acyl carrier protein [Paenibacillus sp. F411]
MNRQIPSFNPVMEIPYYYPCHFPLIHEVLQRQGCHSSLSLLANSRLYGLPSCSSEGLVKTYHHKLNYGEPVWRMKSRRELPGFQEGLGEIKRCIDRGELFLATGSSYYLPYCDDYMNPNYIEKLVQPQSRLYLVDHWLAVYGIKEDELLVYDPVPAKYQGSISMENFQAFWRGNKCIPELAAAKKKEELYTYSTLDIEADEGLHAQGYLDILLQTAATTVQEFMAGREVHQGGRTYFFGQRVTRELLNQLHSLSENDENGLRLAAAFTFDMRWSRYFFRDLMLETASVAGSPFTELTSRYEHLLSSWEQAHKLLQLKHSLRRPGWLQPARQTIQQLAEDELRWFEEMGSVLKHRGHFQQWSTDAEAKDLDKPALTRIILDSCAEMNRYQNTGIPVECGLQTPLYGRDGKLDSLGLVTLLVAVEQSIEEEFEVSLSLSELAAASQNENPFQSVASLAGYVSRQLSLQREESHHGV